MQKLNGSLGVLWIILFTVIGCCDRKDFEDYLTKARKSFQKNDYHNAAAYAQKFLELDNTSIRAFTLLAASHYQLGNLDESEEAYLDALKLSKGFLGIASSGIAFVYESKREFDKAIDVLQQLLDVRPTESTYYQLGTVYFLNTQYQLAIDAFNKAKRIEFLFPMTYFYRGMSYVKLERRADALSEYEKFKEYNETLAGSLYAEIEKMQ